MNNVGYLMAERVAEEINKLGKTQVEVARKLGCSAGLVRKWANAESVPSSAYLAQLHNIGADVMYIITGKRLWDKVYWWMDTALADIPHICETCAFNRNCDFENCNRQCGTCDLAQHCRSCREFSQWQWHGFTTGGDTQCMT